VEKVENYLNLDHVEQTYLPSSSRHVKRFIVSRNNFIKMLDQNGYRLISQYIGVDNHVTVICPNGHEWNTCCYTSFRNNVRCRICDGQCPDTTRKLFYEELNKEGYTLLTPYINTNTNVSVICPNNHQWDTCNPSRFNNGVRCKVCDGQCSNDAKVRFDRLLEERGDKALSEYLSANTKVVIKFGNCGHIADTLTPSRYKLRNQCPLCSNQQKESRLATFTKEMSKQLFNCVEFEYKILKNESTQYYLPFDVYIPSKNALIEVQGQQHYEYNKMYHKNEKDFQYRQELDQLKKEWAILNGYKFIEIDIRKHTEETVLKLLNKLKNMEE
jgi:hypothetical protein